MLSLFIAGTSRWAHQPAAGGKRDELVPEFELQMKNMIMIWFFSPRQIILDACAFSNHDAATEARWNLDKLDELLMKSMMVDHSSLSAAIYKLRLAVEAIARTRTFQ